MKFGVILPQTEIGLELDDVVRFAETAQAAGFSYLVVYDHVLGADRRVHRDWRGPYDLDSPFHEPFVLFGYLAARTDLELMPGVLVLPQRQTALVAKQAAEVDVLTGGRFRLGVGIGWNEVEYEALGADFARRAAVYEEQVELLRLLWTQDSVTFEGRFHTVAGAGLLPRPVQQPIPVWMGGGTVAPVLDRIGRLADGWVCNTAPGHGLEEAWEAVGQAAADAGRPDGAVGLQGTAQPLDAADPIERIQRYAAKWDSAGATHVSVSGLNGGRSPAEHIELIRAAGNALLG